MLFISILLSTVSAAAVPVVVERAVDTPALNFDLSPRQVGQCQVDSCSNAALAGSSTGTYTSSDPVPGGELPGDICCLAYYNPSIKDTLYAQTNDALYCSIFPYTPSNSGVSKREPDEAQQFETRQTSVTCAPKILIWSRGTFEPSGLGIVLGPSIQSQLNAIAPGVWSVESVQYDPSLDGDGCLGLPGGVDHAKPLLAQTLSSCPSSRVFVGGYSQGAMVVRNAIAYSDVSIASKVQGVLTYGDPFDGADIKNYNGPIITYCTNGDGVCNGQLNITVQHLASYGGQDVNDGCARLNAL